MARKKKGKNPAGYGGPEVLASGLVRWKATVGGRRRHGPARSQADALRAGLTLNEAARLAFWEMVAEERRKADEAAVRVRTLAWHLFDLYRKAGVVLDGVELPPGTLVLEGYSPDSLALGRLVLDNHVREDAIGFMDVAQLRTLHLRDWLGRLPGKPRTRARYFSVVAAALQRLVDDGALESNPARGVKLPRADEPEIRILKDVAQAGFLAALKEPPSEERLRALAALRATRKAMAGGQAKDQLGRVLGDDVRRRTYEAGVLMLHGLRSAEACGLRHEMYDPEGRGVRIVRQKKRDGSVRETTKNGRERWVPLDGEACAIMERRESGWVFPVHRTVREKGAPRGSGARVEIGALNPRQLERDMDAQLALTPYAGIDPHDLRHSTVHSLKKAEDVRTAADILGHSPAVLLGVYDRSDEEDRRRALGRARGGDRPTDRPTGRGAGGSQAREGG